MVNRKYVVEGALFAWLLIVAVGGLGVSVVVASREARWGLGGAIQAGTVAAGVAWAVLYCSVAACLSLLAEIDRRARK